MSKCPKCKEEIQNLGFSAKTWNSGIYQKNNPNGEDWEVNEPEDYDWDEIQFFCPKCDERIAVNQEEADNLLKEK